MADYRAKVLLCLSVLLLCCVSSQCKKKSVLDYTEADIERIYDEWGENDPDEEGDEDDWPVPPGPTGGVRIEDLQSGKLNPEEMMKLSKKGKPIMLFIGVRGEPDRKHTESVSQLWAQSLQNAHLQVQRYIVADDRVLLMVNDGSQAWPVRDYLVTQDTCTTVSFEQQTFNCHGWSDNTKTEL